MMTRKEKARIRKVRRNSFIGVLFILLIIIFFSKRNTLNFKKSSYVHAVDVDKSFVDSMVLKNPVIGKLDEDLIKKKEAELEKELIEIREKRRAQEEKIKAEEAKRKIAYLTFDDGPSRKSTPQILDVLKKYDIHATFFVLGRMVDANPDILERIYDEGHAIGHHSYTHNYSHIYSSPDYFMNELARTDRSLKNILGEDFETKLMRLPGGAFGEKKQKYVSIAYQKGYVNYNWNALNGDSEGHNMSKEYLINRLKDTVGGQKKVVILMHDTDAKFTTVQSLPESIEYLQGQGYEFRKLEIGES